MKKRIILLIGFIFLLNLAGCLNDEAKRDRAEGLEIRREQRVVTVSETNNFEGLEVVLNRIVDKKDVKINENYMSIFFEEEEKTIIALVKKNEDNNSKDLFTINDCKEGLLVKARNSSSLTEFKNSVRSEGSKVSEDFKCLGDINLDGKVGLIDLSMFKDGYGKKLGDSDYISACDISPAEKGTGDWSGIYSVLIGDDKVNISDFIIFAKNYGLSEPIVDNSPEVTITPALEMELLEGATQLFVATATDDGEIISYLWSDGTTESTAEITFDKLGENIITVEVTDNGGNVTTKSVTIIIKSKETLSFPSNFGVKDKGDSFVELEWDAVTGTSDYEYVIEKSEEINGTYEQVELVRGIRVYFQSDKNSLNLHYKGSDEKWTVAPGVEMNKVTSGDYNGWFTYDVKDTVITFVTNYNNTEWYKNNDDNFVISETGIYEVKENNDPKKVGDIIAESDNIIGTSFKDTGLKAGTNYFYKIKTVGKTEQSNFTEPFEVKTTEKVYELIIAPYLTWNEIDQSATGIVVNYGTNTSGIAKVEYGTTMNLGTNIEGDAVDTLSKDGKTLYLNHVVINSLDADTKYYYRVFEGNHSSKIYNFTTAKENPTSYRFFAAGDMQDPNTSDSEQRWGDVANEMEKYMKDHRVDFFMSLGDMPRNDLFDNWVQFFDLGKEVFPYLVMMPTTGNHDTDGTKSGDSIYSSSIHPLATESYRKIFKYLPNETRDGIESNGTFYRFKYGNSNFVSLNSEHKVSGDWKEKGTKKQYKWSKDLLEKESKDFTWSFMYWHIGPYIAIDRHGYEQYDIRDMTDFYDGKVDWCLNGHVHCYHRMKPLRYNAKFVSEYGREDGQGIGYINVPPAGNFPEPYTLKYFGEDDIYPNNSKSIMSEVGFIIISIDGSKFDMKTFGIGNLNDKKELHLLDSLNYTKKVVGLIANAGEDIRINVGDVANFDATDSESKTSTIVSYEWSNNLSGEIAEMIYDQAGTYIVQVTITDGDGEKATDTVNVIVSSGNSYIKSFDTLDFRGTSNNWEKTPMILTGDYIWEVEILVSEDEVEPRFKFYVDSSEKWYGDNEPDTYTHSTEGTDIFLSEGNGIYKITINDNTRKYSVIKK